MSHSMNLMFFELFFIIIFGILLEDILIIIQRTPSRVLAQVKLNWNDIQALACLQKLREQSNVVM